MKSLFDDIEIKDVGAVKKLTSDKEMFSFLKNFIVLTETECTPYKYRKSTYSKKAHYINGKRVNRQVYNYIKRWMMNQEKENK